MRIVVLVPKLHAPSELALNKLLQRSDLNIVGVVRSDISILRKRYWRYIAYGVRRSGLFYGALIGVTAYLPLIGVALASALFWTRKRRWLTVDELVRKHNLWIHDTEEINSPISVDVLKHWAPDILVSLYFDQILKKPVIKTPKVAAINMHPGLLPRYRGLWPEFWKLHNREKKSGISIHHIVEKIDAGEVIAQMSFPIRKHDTKFSLGLKGAQHGSKLLIETLLKIKNGIHLKPIKLKGKGRYYSLPQKMHFNNFYRRGKRLFSILGFWKELDRRF